MKKEKRLQKGRTCKRHLKTLLLAGLLCFLTVMPAKAAEIGKVFGLCVERCGVTSVELSWQGLSGVSGYIISVGDAFNKTEIGRSEGPSYLAERIDGKPLITGKTYTFYVQAYQTSEREISEQSGAVNQDTPKELLEERGDYSEGVTATPALAPVSGFTAEGYNNKTVLLRWQSGIEADGYVIYKSKNKKTGFKPLKTLTKRTATSFKDKKCTAGVLYYYKIVPYCNTASGRVYGTESEILESATLLKAPKLSRVSIVDGTTAQVVWKKVTGAKGYIVYRSTSKKGTYTAEAVVENGSVTSVYVPGQENGKKYFYKVVAYANKKRKKTHSAFSKIKSLTFNAFGSDNETYMQKAKRIFGTSYYKKYGSEAEAKSHQKTITVAVWDFAADGVTKVTKYRTLMVHEKIAPTVQQIFKEIYEGEEQFPIKNVGGYSWRGLTSRSEHCEGLAIDINWEENYLIDNGQIQSGKLYEPGVNPYSIPTDGEVARIMKKYGFSQGLWGNRCDYMHFSYFGT